MSSPRLKTQFETLFEHFKGHNSDVFLEEIISILCCTRRNARIVLNKMADEGWIEWHPAPGRGNLSTIIFKRNQQDINQNLAKRYLKEGRFEQAFDILKKEIGAFTKVIEDYLGLSHEQGQQVVRLPYYRPLSILNPTKPHQRSEQNIIRKIFSGLTKLDEHDVLQPDLSHTWETKDAKHWRFYLRSGVRFHNGNLLQESHVVDSISALNTPPNNVLHRHIQSVSSPQPHIIDIFLKSPDWHFPLLLAESSAKIMPPAEWQQSNFDTQPIGTGPYKVKLNNEKRLTLEAFDHYFGYRPLVDKIEVCVIDAVHSSTVFPNLTYPIRLKKISNNEANLDPGCIFLLLNRNNGLAKCDHWANYFCSTLSVLNLFKLLPEDKIIELGLLPAFGLKPGWQHSLINREKLLPPTKEKVTIAYHTQDPICPTLAKTISKILNKDGITVEFKKYQHSVDDLNIVDDLNKVDLWLKPMEVGSYRDNALASWLLSDSHIPKLSNAEQFKQWHHFVEEWRQNKNTVFPARQLGKALVENHQIIPLLHCWLGISKDHFGSLNNMKYNALEWFG